MPGYCLPWPDPKRSSCCRKIRGTGTTKRRRDGDILDTECPVAVFTEKMDMAVKGRMAFGRIAQLIFQGAAAILDGMDDIVLKEQCKHAENA